MRQLKKLTEKEYKAFQDQGKTRRLTKKELDEMSLYNIELGKRLVGLMKVAKHTENTIEWEFPKINCKCTKVEKGLGICKHGHFIKE